MELKCSVPGYYKSSFTSYQWFKESQKLAQTGETIRLWKLKSKDGGKFSCQGTRDTAVGTIRTQPSLPVEVNVDGRILCEQIFPKMYFYVCTADLKNFFFNTEL